MNKVTPYTKIKNILRILLLTKEKGTLVETLRNKVTLDGKQFYTLLKEIEDKNFITIKYDGKSGYGPHKGYNKIAYLNESGKEIVDLWRNICKSIDEKSLLLI
jgi:DNA-binding PadR family transcriptional regulator